MANRQTIVLFKADTNDESSNDSDLYIEILKNNNIYGSIIPSLDFNYINADILANYLKVPDDFSGLIFTSPRTVKAIYKTIEHFRIDISKWQEKSNHSVGEKTSSCARSLLQINTVGFDSNCSEKLCDSISLTGLHFKPFLYPCSNKRKDTIPEKLSSLGYKITEIVCYETFCHPDLKMNWENFISKEGIPRVLVFFSPSGVEYIHEMVKESCKVLPMSVAIGGVTEKSLHKYYLNPKGVAISPTPDSILEIIKKLL